MRVRDLHIMHAATGRMLVDGVSFDVAHGENVGIVGQSGSGKSLTLRAIMGLLPPGVAVVPSSASHSPIELDAGESPAMIFQDPVASLDPLAGVVHQVAAVMHHRQGLPRREARRNAAETLVQLGLPESLRTRDRYPGQLSGGQCQRVGIAMALVCRPGLLLCDEPTTALDVTVQRRILDLLAGQRERLGLSMIFVTHDLGVAARMCSRLIVMHGGRVVESGPTDELLAHPQEEYTRRLIDAVQALGTEEGGR